MSEIQSYIEKLKIKDVFIGGFDKEEVYTSMQKLSSMYQKDIVQLETENERLETAYKTTANELEQANKDIQLLKFQLEEEKKSQNKYDLRFNALTQAIDAVSASKEDVIEEAKKTAEGIIAEANEKFERISQECLFQKQQQDLVLSKITDAKQRFGSSIKSLHSILTKMLLDVDVLQKDGFEQEFNGDEIDNKSEIGDDTAIGEFQSPFDDETNRLLRMITGSVSKYGS